MQGFYWSANSPYIRGMWVRVRRAPRAPALSAIVADGFIATDTVFGTQLNANPAYIVYEALTNTDWGMGDSPDSIDDVSFKYAAGLFRNEGFGLFVTWVKQETIENFVSEILDHVQAALFLHPSTGKWTLKALRDDYTVSTLPRYTPANADIADFDRKVWGETINEIAVTWTNPVNEQAETVTIQDLANITQQGGQIVSQPRNYYGIRSAVLALTVAARDLRTAVAPLATCTLKALRSAWDLVPGDCLALDWPEEDAQDMVMRVQVVDYGNKSDGYVNVTLIEDIFALDAPAYVAAPSSNWSTTRMPPNPLADVKIITAPAYLIANPNPPLDDALEDPEVVAALLMSDANPDFSKVEPYTMTVLSTGAQLPRSIGARDRVAHTVLTATMVSEASTTITFPVIDGAPPRLGMLVFIGEEIALIQSVQTDGTTYILARGALDTVPTAHNAGTEVYFLGTESVLDTNPRAPGETVSYRPLMRTSLGLLPYDAGTDETAVLTNRPYRPLRPANVKLNGQGFGTVHLNNGGANFTWSNRNRLTETSQILGWTAGSVAPESGQLTGARGISSDGVTVLYSYSPVSGTSMSIGTAPGVSFFDVYSVRGGVESLQAFRIAADNAP